MKIGDLIKHVGMYVQLWNDTNGHAESFAGRDVNYKCVGIVLAFWQTPKETPMFTLLIVDRVLHGHSEMGEWEVVSTVQCDPTVRAASRGHEDMVQAFGRAPVLPRARR